MGEVRPEKLVDKGTQETQHLKLIQNIRSQTTEKKVFQGKSNKHVRDLRGNSNVLPMLGLPNRMKKV